MRVALATSAAIFGYVGVTFSLAQAFVGERTMQAFRLAPYDGRIIAARSAELAATEKIDGNRLQSDKLARLALRQDPTAVAALATLGVNAQIRGDEQRSRAYFGLAERLSRRHLPVQLWAIEEAVARNDIYSALKHYDIALRTNQSASNLLFPVLAAASGDSAIRPAVVRVLATRPVWGESFVNYVANNSSDPRVTAGLYTDLAHVGVDVPETARAVVINALLVGGHADKAWSYYIASQPGARRDRTRNPSFKSNLKVPSRFDWLATNDADITTTIRDAAFDFTVPPSVGGVLLQQVQLLPVGTYQLTGRSAEIDQAPDARPYWVLECLQGRELGRINLPNSSEANGIFAGTLRVPADCPVQVLKLVARSSDAPGGVTGFILHAQFVPARRSR